MVESPLPAFTTRRGPLANLVDLAAIPGEEVWLASQKSAHTRCAYKLDVAHIMKTLGISTPDMLRQVDHRSVIAWERIMREEGEAASIALMHDDRRHQRAGHHGRQRGVGLGNKEAVMPPPTD